tara:strand:+ start:55 stop:294 length:240 start_codon:yes stop_codon:yes gene_type:complete
MEKLTKSELKILQESVGKLNDIYISIGQLENRKQDLLIQCAAAEADTKEITEDFQEKYGVMEVNINTGEMRKIEKNEQE